MRPVAAVSWLIHADYGTATLCSNTGQVALATILLEKLPLPVRLHPRMLRFRLPLEPAPASSRETCESGILALELDIVMQETSPKPSWKPDRNGDIILSGPWSLMVDERLRRRLLRELRQLESRQDRRWILRELDTLDSTGALLLWHVWGGHLPTRLDCNDAQRHLFQWLEHMQPVTAPTVQGRESGLSRLGAGVLLVLQTGAGILLLLGQVLDRKSVV